MQEKKPTYRVNVNWKQNKTRRQTEAAGKNKQKQTKAGKINKNKKAGKKINKNRQKRA